LKEGKAMFIKAPFLIPHDFLREFSYPGHRRFVALYWTPLGDEACFNDGQTSASGLSDNWIYLSFARRKDVWAWRDENELHFGDSDEEATHWLIVDKHTDEVYAAPKAEARQAVIDQTIPE
jgi:hypothetical protein